MCAMSPDDDYARLRPLLLAIAYRMVGSVGEAEDLVQEAFLRHHRARAEGVEIASARAYLSTVVTRLAIDHLRSARVRRETYVGPWLPEPLVTDPQEDPGAHAELADALSLALLHVLERLAPVERAAFLLREVFDFPYDAIAATLERSEANCRQLVTRARRHLEAERPRVAVTRARQLELTARFMQACVEGETAALVGLLAQDAIAYTDGGGKARAARKPIYGGDRVARLFVGITRPERAPEPVQPHLVDVNGVPGLAIASAATGATLVVLVLDVGPGELIRSVLLVSNPDKLAHLPPRVPWEVRGSG